MPKRNEITIAERLRGWTALVSAAALAFQPALAFALPQGGQVSAGQAGIAPAAGQLTVNQSSQRAVIDWNSFNVGAGEGVQFRQPASSSITLNRIHDANPSSIEGQITANGQVWLVNPNGVMFGQGAQINVGGLLATTADIDNSRFMSGDYTFNHPGNPLASIFNLGRITIADGGLAALVGPNVSNSGMIEARLGKVQLASGDTFTLDLYGDGLINLNASPAMTQQLVSNSGMISADGGSVLLTAAAAENTINSLINMDGVIEANSLGDKQGTITLYAEGSNAVQNNIAADKGQKSGTSTVLVSGLLDASGYGAGQTGGSISVLGDNVGILSGSIIDASGDIGGGTIKIGGDFHGAGTTPTASRTVVQGSTNLYANATDSGNGGHVTVWADDWTNFAGSIEVKGGPNGGNGGFVETSGKQTLSMSGDVNASAPKGNAGTWLMDPNNVILNTSDSNESGDPNFVMSGSGSIDVSHINTDLSNGTNVNVTASGSIEVANNISKTGGADASLTLAAGTDITIDSAVTISSSHNKLGVTLDADTALGGGAIVMNSGSGITSNGGDIVLGGGATPLTTAAVGDAAYNNGIQLNNATLNAGGGSITMNGTGYSSGGIANSSGIYAYGGSIIETTGGGNMTMTGTGGDGATRYSLGVQLGDGIDQVSGPTEATVSAANGTIAITGTGGTDPGFNLGIDTWDGLIETSGTGAGHGNITLNGGDGNGATGGIGVGLAAGTAGTPAISTVDGNISITGTGVGDGINIFDGLIRTTGSGNITLTGTGNGTNGGNGVTLDEDTAAPVLSTVDGSISITGISGSGDGSSNEGIYNSTTIVTTGRGNITMNGTGGSGNNGYGNIGIINSNDYVSGIIETTGSGNITLTGTGGSGNNSVYAGNIGFLNGQGATIEATGSGNVTLTGTGSTGNNNNFVSGGPVNYGNQGVFNDADDGNGHGPGIIKTASGTLTITGVDGSGTASLNTGLVNAGTIGDGSTTGNITMTATGDIVESGGSTTTHGGNIVLDADTALGGGAIALANSTLTSNGGDITLGGGANPLTGYARALESEAGTITYFGQPVDSGIFIDTNSVVDAGGGNITMHGWGGVAVGGFDPGIHNAGTIQTSGNGNITLSGIGGNVDGGTWNSGIANDGATIQITGAGNGSITLTGTGGNGAGNNNSGIGNEGTISTTGSGSITLIGTGGSGAGSDNSGMYSGTITAAGTGSITMTATGDIVESGGSTTTHGGSIVLDADTGGAGGAIAITNSTLTSNGGDITLGGGLNPLTGYAVSSGSNTSGISIDATSTLNAGGGTIIMHGQSNANSLNDNDGIANAGIIETSGVGAISLTGTGGNGAGAFNNSGVVNTGTIETTGSGSITLTGTGGTGNNTSTAGNGDNGNVGIDNEGTIETTAAGNIIMTGSGGTGSNGESNAGINSTGTIAAAGSGNITLVGTGGTGDNGDNSNVGFGNTGTINTTSGNLTITGNGGTGAGGGNYGFFNGSTINTTSGDLTITGIEGSGTGSLNTGIVNAGAIGDGSTSGNTTLKADSINLDLGTIETTGNLTLKPYTAGTTIGIGSGTGNLSIDDTALATFTYGSLTIGSGNTGAMDIDSGVTFTQPVIFQTGSRHDIILDGALASSSAGSAFILAAGRNFINDAGASPLTASGGRWLIYSTNPGSNTLDGLTSDFSSDGCTYGGTCSSVPSSGNGLLYSYTPLPDTLPSSVMWVLANGSFDQGTPPPAHQDTLQPIGRSQRDGDDELLVSDLGLLIAPGTPGFLSDGDLSSQ